MTDEEKERLPQGYIDFLKMRQELLDFEISRHINIACAEIHKRTLRRAQYVICEGDLMCEWADRNIRDNVYRNSLYVVKVGSNTKLNYKDCITIVQRGDFSRFEIKEPTKSDSIPNHRILSIPEFVSVPTEERQDDIVVEYYLTFDKDGLPVFTQFIYGEKSLK